MRRARIITTLVVVVSLLLSGSCSVFSRRAAANKVERSMLVKSHRIREPLRIRAAKAKQERNQSRLKNDYHKSIKASRKRTYEIQTDEVKARMKRNEIDLAKREKEKSRIKRAAKKNNGRKYR